ncbi:MAG: hypothetical protein KCHDKBKB_00623 [Elusimicrobia bacterium]|nr:hypothetical protein [Elusimicrobiota bacterium]
MSPRIGLYDIVERVLRESKKSRTDDKLLIWLVYKALGLVTEERVGLFKTEEYMTWEAFKDSPTPESITRARRKKQEEIPELAPNWELLEVRRELAKEIDKMKPKSY